MRLVFEEGLFPYKFMALAVMLVLLAVVQGAVRARLIAWLALLALAFSPIPVGYTINARSWGYPSLRSCRLVGIGVVLVFIARDAVYRRVRWYLVAWFVLATWAFCNGRCGRPTHSAPTFRSGSGRSSC